MALRKIRKDCKVGTIEKRLGLPGLFKNKNGRDTRSDKRLGNVLKDLKKK